MTAEIRTPKRIKEISATAMSPTKVMAFHITAGV